MPASLCFGLMMCEAALFLPPVTVESVHESSRVVLIGETRRSTYTDTEARRGDGSVVRRRVSVTETGLIDRQTFRGKWMDLWDASSGTSSTADDGERKIVKQRRTRRVDRIEMLPRKPMQTPLPAALAPEGACVATATRGIRHPKKFDSGRIAGYAVEWYRGPSRSHDNYEVEQALAPGLLCDSLEYFMLRTSVLGLRLDWYRSRVLSIRLGEPDAALFRLPDGYRVQSLE